MENLLNKLNKMTMVAVALAAVSISMINFEDLSWNKNIKSYIGIIIVLTIFVARFYIKTISERKK